VSGGDGADAAADSAHYPGEPEIWRWVRETYFEPAISLRETRSPFEDVVRDRAQIVFRSGLSPEVRFGREVRGQEVVESQPRVPGGAEWIEDSVELDVSRFELPPEDSNAGHITAFSTSSGLDIVILGAAMTESITSELAAADEFIDSAERALAGPLGPFANAAYPAAEMLARAELLRLPDPRLNAAKTHRTVRSRYNMWANVGNTKLRFAAVLNDLADWQNNAKYERSRFSLSSDQAAECMETIKEMRSHAEQRPRRRLSAAPGQFSELGQR
jgi:hypothetical protein